MDDTKSAATAKFDKISVHSTPVTTQVNQTDNDEDEKPLLDEPKSRKSTKSSKGSLSGSNKKNYV